MTAIVILPYANDTAVKEWYVVVWNINHLLAAGKLIIQEV